MSKRKYNEITMEQRKLVLDGIDRGQSLRTISTEFGISVGTVSSIKANKVKILECLQQNCSSDRKRTSRSTPNDELNSEVYQFLLDLRRENVSVTGPMLKAKALRVATLLEINNFKASNGWLESFQKRHNVQFTAANGESAEVGELVEVILGTSPVESKSTDDQVQSATRSANQSNTVLTPKKMSPPVKRAKKNSSLTPVPADHPAQKTLDDLPIDPAVLKLCQVVADDLSDTFDKFGSLVASQLRSLPTAEGIRLQREIQQLITDRLIANCNGT